ncbi:unnamed protein product [Calicophoron daubneyi]|uniref:Uncharacterized protein n=1 Tax=Calicophoron daubneyi TaxID=300641 RepID=A0AAV2TEJ7_CALDB
MYNPPSSELNLNVENVCLLRLIPEFHAPMLDEHLKAERKAAVVLKRLDYLLMQLDGYQPLLKHNASYAEFAIRAHFDSLMDALRQRQMTLLKQLDNVYKEKSSLIDGQKQGIEKIRAGILSCIPKLHDEDSLMDEFVSRAESAALNSSLAPFVSFRTEKSLLHEAISRYGRIVSRYSGHFADPNQPSSCLPRAVEEEDDHEETDDQPVVFSRVVPCSCVNPSLQQWLFRNDHSCGSSKYLCLGNLKKTPCCAYPRDASASSVQSTPEHFRAVSELAVTGRTRNHLNTVIPTHMLSSSIVHKWMDTDQPQKMNNLLSLSDPDSQKDSSTLQGSDCPIGSDSESIAVLTGSSGRSENLKEWLFRGPTELCEMPGLSTSLPWLSANQVRNNKMNGEISSPLLSSANEQCASITSSLWTQSGKPSEEQVAYCTQSIDIRSSLFPDYLTQSNPIDLDRWLQRENPDCTPTPSLTGPQMGNNSPQVVSQICPSSKTDSEIRLSTCSACHQSHEDCATNKRFESSQNHWTIIHRMTLDQYSDSEAGSVKQVANPSSPTANPVIAHLNRIAESHWRQWISADSLSDYMAYGSRSQSIRKSQNSDFEEHIPRHPTEKAPHESDPPAVCSNMLDTSETCSDESITPPKRRSTTERDDSGGVVQSPFIHALDTNNDSNKVPGKWSEILVPTQSVVPPSRTIIGKVAELSQTNESVDELDKWLQQKMPALSITNSKSAD